MNQTATLPDLNKAQILLGERLGDSWMPLAAGLGIPPEDCERFAKGDECGQILNWLQRHDRLGQLPDALIAAGRDDLALLLQPPPLPNLTKQRWKTSPYPGLRPFPPDYAPVFCGRDRETADLITRFQNPAQRLLAIVGPSGAGKSSLIAAGLLAGLQQDALPDGKDWQIVSFSPAGSDDDPFAALAVRLEPLLQPQGWTRSNLQRKLQTIGGFAELAADILNPVASAELLLVIDPFEELFVLCPRALIPPFIALLEDAVRTPRVRIVIALRSDFLPSCLQYPRLAALLSAGLYPLSPPGPAQLYEMITVPAALAGIEFETAELPWRILEDTAADTLPLMACALAELYDRRHTDGTLIRAAYDNFGGLRGIIDYRTNEIYQEVLDRQSAAVADLIFDALVTIDPERLIAVCRRVPLDRLPSTPATSLFIDAFSRARLLVWNESRVEIAHEALFHAWRHLSRWIADRCERLRAGPELEAAAGQWQALGRPWSRLAPAARLEHYRQAPHPSSDAQAFLRAGQRRQWLRRSLVAVAVGLALVIPLGTIALYAGNLSITHATAMLLDSINRYPIQEPEMIEIPAGEFSMGAHPGEPEALPPERPSHQVKVGAFAIGQYEVTFDEYDQFSYATGRPLVPDQGWGRGRQPVVNVSWEDANAYAQWLSRKTGKHYRLPSEAEWEYAARARSETARYWGDDPKLACSFANVADLSFYQAGYGDRIHDCNDQFVETAPVGSFEANGYGLHDMLGNVWEWVQDSRHPNYKDAPVDGSAWESDKNLDRMVRGGSWMVGPRLTRVTTRGSYRPSARSDALGFRVAREMQSTEE